MESLEKAVLETGLSREFVEKEAKLNELLSKIVYACLRGGVDYSLYGGTAINKIYLDEPRFSEDLDFFFYGQGAAETERLLRAAAEGFTLSKPRKIFGKAFRFDASYGSGKVSIDANLSLGKRKTAEVLLEPKTFLSKHGYAPPLPKTSTFPVETLAAMKLLALTTRAEGKDYYDLYRLLSLPAKPLPLKTVLAEAFKYHDALFDFAAFDEELLENAVAAVRGADERALAATDAYVMRQRRVDWTALKKDLVRLIRTRIT